jgi:thiamine biosynthesis lipoprotein ApbE
VVIAESAALAEIFSTAFLSMGKESAARFSERKDIRIGWLEPGPVDRSLAWL